VQRQLQSLITSKDDHFVIAITDANFARYGITADDLRRAMNRHPKVKVALICIGEGAEATWCVPLPGFAWRARADDGLAVLVSDVSFCRVPKQFPGRAFRVEHTSDIPKVLRGILSTMMER
jgi:hypothetical protein